MKIVIDTNVFFIPERLREIDRDYYVVRDLNRKVFEIHNSAQPHNSYCLTVPYNELDCRALELVLKTRVQNVEKIIAEMDADNAKLVKNSEKVFEEAGSMAKDILNYANRHTLVETVDDGAFSTRFI